MTASSCQFKCRLTVGSRTFKVIPASRETANATSQQSTATASGTLGRLIRSGASAPAEIVLGSDDHLNLLVQRIQELTAKLVLPGLPSTEYDSTAKEIAERAVELKFVRENAQGFATLCRQQSKYLGDETETGLNEDGIEGAIPFDSASTTASAVDDDELVIDNANSTVASPRASISSGISGSTSGTVHVTVSKFGQLEQYQAIHVDEGDDKLLRRPIARQFFAPNGVFHRTEKHIHVPWQELFQDLIYVGALAKVGYAFHHDISWVGLGQFTLLYIPLLYNWVMCTMYNNRFAHNDLYHKWLTIFQMIVVMSLAVNAANAFHPDPDINTSSLYLWTVCVGFLVVNGAYAIASVANPHVRYAIAAQTLIRVPEVSLYIAAALAEHNSTTKYALWACAILLGSCNYFASGLANKFIVRNGKNGLGIGIEHLVERYGLYVIVTLGEIAVGILFKNAAGSGAVPMLGATFGILTAYALQFIYFRVEASAHRTHAIRRSAVHGISWSVAHIPLTWSIVVCSSCIAGFVSMLEFAYMPIKLLKAEGTTAKALLDAVPTTMLAAAAPDASSDPLAVSSFHNWIFWVSLAATFAVMGIMGKLHHARPWDPRTQFLSPNTLVAARFAFALVFVVMGAVAQVGMFGPLAQLGSAACVAVVASFVEEVGRVAPPEWVKKVMVEKQGKRLTHEEGKGGE
ncbi:bacterial low temperature requirement A protein-domain-containing protein [Catenaria anguillulae PL171]|uniref:Bacterial low temperature requirement A protein-domain-containing protein n=1 Tax=Catenaria anguillulae PL171 TaxID=765915 RepID=A0A1Y2I105_9FUNG|nr:bacterial low temperature requirement A protein-domain-containing protein [Catenaria anguillulae PL171]